MCLLHIYACLIVPENKKISSQGPRDDSVILPTKFDVVFNASCRVVCVRKILLSLTFTDPHNHDIKLDSLKTSLAFQ